MHFSKEVERNCWKWSRIAHRKYRNPGFIEVGDLFTGVVMAITPRLVNLDTFDSRLETYIRLVAYNLMADEFRKMRRTKANVPLNEIDGESIPAKTQLAEPDSPFLAQIRKSIPGLIEIMEARNDGYSWSDIFDARVARGPETVASLRVWYGRKLEIARGIALSMGIEGV